MHRALFAFLAIIAHTSGETSSILDGATCSTIGTESNGNRCEKLIDAQRLNRAAKIIYTTQPAYVIQLSQV